MAQGTPKNFTVIKFTEMPGDIMYEYQCVPSTWIKVHHGDGIVTVAYPPHITSDLDIWIRTKKKPLYNWGLFSAISVIEIDDYAQWKMILAIIINFPSIDVWQLKNLFCQNDGDNPSVIEPEVVLSEMRSPVLPRSFEFSPQPSTSSQNVTPVLETRRRESVRQSNGSAGTGTGSQRPSLDSSHEELKNVQRNLSNVPLGRKRTSQKFTPNQGGESQQTHPKNVKMSTPRSVPTTPARSKQASTPATRIEDPVVVQLKDICKLMNELLTKMLAVIQEIEK